MAERLLVGCQESDADDRKWRRSVQPAWDLPGRHIFERLVSDISGLALGGRVVASIILTITSPSTKPVPATIGTVFGGLWALVGALALPVTWRWPIAVAAAIVTVLLVVRLWRAADRAGAGPTLFSKAPYRWAVASELVAIAAASALLPRLGAQASLMPTIGVIVGLHFIGLWLATRSRRFLVICVGMCGVSGCALFVPELWHGLDLRAAVAGFGNALVLWLGASRSR